MQLNYTFLTLSIVLLAANKLSELNTSHSSQELEQTHNANPQHHFLGIVASHLKVNKCRPVSKYCIQRKFRPRFIFALFTLWLEGEFITGPIALFIPYKRKFSRESNFRYFREQFENAKICLCEKLYLKRKFKSLYRYDILLHTLSNLKSGCKSRNHLV